MPKILSHTAASCLGIVLFVFLLLDEAKSEQLPSNGCPPSRSKGRPMSSLCYVVKAIDVSGVVCVRVVNGFSEDLMVGGSSLRQDNHASKRDS
jgi:hypothetical protein